MPCGATAGFHTWMIGTRFQAFGNFDGKKQIPLTEFHQVWQIFLLNCSQGLSTQAVWAFRSAGTSHSVLPILGSLVSKAIRSSLNPFAELRV